MANDPNGAAKALGLAPSVHRTAPVRATIFGQFCDVVARTQFGRVKRLRFGERAVEQWLAVTWWDWPHERLGIATGDCRTLGAEEFCAEYEER